MELVVMWVICLVQFAVIAWLAYPRLKPKALDVWAKADETLKRLNRSDAENWEIDFKRLQGIEPEKPATETSKHDVVEVHMLTGRFFNGWLSYTCSCGYTEKSMSKDSMQSTMKTHRENAKAAGIG